VFGTTAVTAVREPRQTPPDATAGLWYVEAGIDRAVLKLVRAGVTEGSRWPAPDDPGSPYWWRREAVAYESGLLRRYGAPASRAVVERGEDLVAIWLDAAPEPPPWTPELCHEISRRLGRAQSQPPPDVPWLGRGFLREYLRLHGVRNGQDVLGRLDEMPSTLCHNDLHPGNVLGARGEVLVDWPYCGLGAAGLDAGVLVADGVADAVFPVERADEFATAVWEGYLDGLGGVYDESDVRFAFARGTALRLSWLPRGERVEWDATIELLTRLASDS
jgi:hypothetical protein